MEAGGGRIELRTVAEDISLGLGGNGVNRRTHVRTELCNSNAEAQHRAGMPSEKAEADIFADLKIQQHVALPLLHVDVAEFVRRPRMVARAIVGAVAVAGDIILRRQNPLVVFQVRIRVRSVSFAAGAAITDGGGKLPIRPLRLERERALCTVRKRHGVLTGSDKIA